MFTVEDVATDNGRIQYRTEDLTGFRSRICSDRAKRGIDGPVNIRISARGCPFCVDRLPRETPTFSDGNRILRGESTTFPNLFPFARWHTVTVITQAHTIDRFSVRQLADALLGQSDSMKGQTGYASINWNYLPSSGASIVHPHMQGLVDARPSALADSYIQGSERYLRHNGKWYWDVLRENEQASERYLFGDEICWIANAVPLGEKEVRGILPVSNLNDWDPWIESVAEGLIRVIELYRTLDTHAFNVSLFFGRDDGSSKGFRAFCSVIARINPNIASLSDSSFMERLHREPVILTFPEDLASQYRMHAAIGTVKL